MLNWGKARALARPRAAGVRPAAGQLSHRSPTVPSKTCAAARALTARTPQVSTPGKSEVKHFPDGLAAEAWASESVAHKLTSGYAVREGEGAAAGMRQEGVPREPLEHGKAHRHAKHEE